MKVIFSILIIVLFSLTSCVDKAKNKMDANLSLDSLLLKYPDSVNLLVLHGESALKDFNYAIAIADAARAFRLDSSNTATRLLYAEALCNKPDIKNNDVTKAQYHYLKIVKLEPKNVRALVGLANTHSLRQDFVQSFKYINKALRINPRYRDAYILKGSNYRVQGNIKLAISSYETAVQQDPTFYGGNLMLGALYESHDDPICIEYYTTAAKQQASNPDVLYSLAYAKQKWGQDKGAQRLYRKMIRLDSTYYDAYFQLGWIKQFSQQDLDSAMYFYSEVLEIEPKHIESHHNMGLIYEDKKDISHALLSYGQVLKYNPEFQLTLDRVAVLKKLR